MQPKIYHVQDHKIDLTSVDSDAIFVINKLREAGYIAFLVGGSVRDLLLKRTPKDFDISTSARPEQIKQVFQRHCLLIGRRFRLAHVRFGHKILEVSTFRSGDDEENLIVQDNQWGTPEQDVLRRDFTINGLYYDPANQTVIDYVGGWEDIHKHTLRTIGVAETRFKQDPVRMIRLLKFRARFDFAVDHAVLRALLLNRSEIIKSSPARILEEILRMLESGYAANFFRLMKDSSLLELLFPKLHHFMENDVSEEVFQYLAAADSINLTSKKKPLDRSVLMSCLIFPILQKEIHLNYLQHNLTPNIGQIMLLVTAITKEAILTSFTHFPRRISSELNFILSTQYRLTPLNHKRHHRPKLIHSNDFILAMKFLKIRALKDNCYLNDYEWWKQQYRQAHEPSSNHQHSAVHEKK